VSRLYEWFDEWFEVMPGIVEEAEWDWNVGGVRR
jgi:hypothetical protein